MNLDEIFNSLYDKIYSFTLMRVGNVHDAEDIASDVFVKVAEKLDTYNPNKAAFSTWIFTIALNEIKLYYRGRKPVYSLDDACEVADRFVIDEDLLRRDERICLSHALRELDERQREIIFLKYFGELPNRRIAEIMDLSETNVETLLYRAKKNMKKVFLSCEESGSCVYKNMRKEESVR